MGIMAVVFCISMILTTGCAKKAVSTDQGLVTGDKVKASSQPETNIKKKEADIAAQQKSYKELALKRDAGAVLAGEKKQTALEDIHFAFDKSTIEPEAREALKQLASLFIRNKDYRLVIEGHCDERGTVEYNLALGQRRADATMKYLVDLGSDKAIIKTITYGKERPLDPGHNEEAWAKNRRAHIMTIFTK